MISLKQKVMKFRPMTVEELCAFIASIRPGFITYYNRFESRVPFSYKLTELDVSKNTALTDLNVVVNRLTELDVSNNTNLIYYLQINLDIPIFLLIYLI